ncbi:hypothetical protein [Priestia megaterium]|jgi:hypothetical protein|uniref:hypothetical protein n=1 Tax=Priestia megaterium TaxID=1404 RepID=UPI000BFD5484|nr:hypothetical protein [Priestia megaterium]PGO60621.1 hypothetical protein CN981_08715 [Priestia megaterium]
MTELKQTKNAFKVIGKVSRIDKDGAFKEDQATKGKREGDTYRSLRFGVKTSETNEITVEMFDYEPTEVFMWNSDLKKKDSKYKGSRFPFAEWEERQDELREEGYAVLQTRIGVTYGEDGKIVSKGLPSFVASQEIYDNLDNDDSVVVEGEIRYSSFEDTQTGKKRERKSFVIKKVHKIKPIDFEDAKFEEVTYFEQEMVFVGADLDRESNKVFVTGRVIDFAQNFHDTQFVVDFSDGQGGHDEGMVKLSQAFLKKFKFGDVLNVFGDTLNRVILEEQAQDDADDDDFSAMLGGRKKPKHAETFVAKTYISEMSIHGIDAWDKRVYQDEDFVVKEVVQTEEKQEKQNPFADLGGKSKSNPFADEKKDEEDDLPF